MKLHTKTIMEKHIQKLERDGILLRVMCIIFDDVLVKASDKLKTELSKLTCI